ncbi:MAG: hypothetical protein ACRD15_09935 [Vicinamibacterales bacterium]
MPIRGPDGSEEPVSLGDTFRLHRERGGQPLEAACRLVTHPSGWELRLEIGGWLQRSQVCRSRDEVLATSDHWRAAMVKNGWR